MESIRNFAAALTVVTALTICPGKVFGQYGGGGHGMGSSGGLGGTGRPTGVSPKDDLKEFHRLTAVQATAEQKTMFASVVQDAQAASDLLKTFREPAPKEAASTAFSDGATSLEKALEKARIGNQSFLASLSPVQKSGLKDFTKRLAKADSELGKQTQELGRIAQTAGANANSVADLEKMLASFQSEQLALGGEMSIVLPAAGEGVTFTLPAVTNSIEIAGQTIAIPVSGTLSQTSSESGHELFRLKLTADLSDLQHGVSDLLRSQIGRAPKCGERIEIQQATLTPLAGSGLVAARLHYSRWFCAPAETQQTPVELTEDESSIEIKFTLAVEQNGLRLAGEIGRINGGGPLRELLSTGGLGPRVRDAIAVTLLSAIQKGVDFKTVLPPTGQGSATIEKAKFEDDGSGRLSLILDGQLQLSDEQAKQFVTQVKQRLAAQEFSKP